MVNSIALDISNNSNLLLGIDGGGTKCKAVLLDNKNTILGTGIAGSGNPVNGLEQAQASIVESACAALKDAQNKHAGLASVELSDLTAGIGLAGVNIPKMHEQMTHWGAPFHSKHITTDLVIACLGAHNGENGAVIISGTGSSGFSYVNGVSKNIGGHGFPQGDKGSGAWFGLKAVETVLLSLDNLAPNTLIKHHLFKTLKVDNAIDIVSCVAAKPPAFFAQLAATVFIAAEEQDDVALSIIHEGANYLKNMAKQLEETGSSRIAFIGGISQFIIPYLIKERQTKVLAPIYPPEIGAVFYARQQRITEKNS